MDEVTRIQELRRALTQSDSGAFLVESRVIRRVIREMNGYARLTTAIPHADLQVVAARPPSVARIVRRQGPRPPAIDALGRAEPREEIAPERTLDGHDGQRRTIPGGNRHRAGLKPLALGRGRQDLRHFKRVVERTGRR